ncbi:MAG: helix-turn-helix domain-containing protein [Dechloromonas sp.]|nr:helix-turn-helix domain-containing protein [Dechloromonas sp.]
MTDLYTPLTKEAVAALMSVSTRTIDNWISDNTLPMPTQIGRRIYWHPDAITTWLNERFQVKPSEPTSLAENATSRGRPRNRLPLH